MKGLISESKVEKTPGLLPLTSVLGQSRWSCLLCEGWEGRAAADRCGPESAQSLMDETCHLIDKSALLSLAKALPFRGT